MNTTIKSYDRSHREVLKNLDSMLKQCFVEEVESFFDMYFDPSEETIQVYTNSRLETDNILMENIKQTNKFLVEIEKDNLSDFIDTIRTNGMKKAIQTHKDKINFIVERSNLIKTTSDISSEKAA